MEKAQKRKKEKNKSKLQELAHILQIPAYLDQKNY